METLNWFRWRDNQTSQWSWNLRYVNIVSDHYILKWEIVNIFTKLNYVILITPKRQKEGAVEKPKKPCSVLHNKFATCRNTMEENDFKKSEEMVNGHINSQ